MNRNSNSLKFAWDDILRNVYEKKNADGNFDFNQSTPTMVLSVIGDTDNHVPTTWPTSVFQKALIEAARNGGETWILYPENDGELSNIVRDAYRNYEIREFGTKTVGISDPYRQIKLISIAEDEQETITKATPLLRDPQSTQSDELTPIYKIPRIFWPRSQNNETFRMEFEKFISEQEIFFFGSNIDFKIPIPIAIIVCEGDLGTITHISKALQNNIPILVMKGSGKAADLVLSYLESPDEIIQKARELLRIEYEDEEFKEMKNHLDEIKAHRDHVAFFDLDQDDPLMLLSLVGNVIVNCKSIQKALKNNTKDVKGIENLQQRTTIQNEKIPTLPMSKHMPKISSSIYWLYKKHFYSKGSYRKLNMEEKTNSSRPYVLNSKFSIPTSLPLCFYFGYQIVEVCGPALLFEAIKVNRCDYVEALLDRGIQFNMNSLFQLYEETITEEDVNFPIAVGILKIALATNDKKSKEETQSNVDQDLSLSIEKAAKTFCRNTLGFMETGSKQKSEDNFISNVLLWAIFANRIELAEIFWLKGTNHLYTGMICSALLKKLAWSNRDDEPMLSFEQETHSILFTQRCLSIMDAMYKENQEYSINSMSRLSEIWGIRSIPLTVALESSNYDILAHISSKKKMDQIWKNNFEPNKVSLFNDKMKFSPLAVCLQGCNSPRTRYILNCIVDFIILILCSMFVLTSIDTNYNYYVQGFAEVVEWTVLIWDFGNVIECVFIVVLMKIDERNNQHSFAIMTLLGGIWPWLDFASYILNILAFLWRHSDNDETFFSTARKLYAISLLCMYFRYLKYLRLSKRFGMMIIMMLKMMKHLLSFLVIAVILGIGVGVYYHANLWPDHQTMWSESIIDWRIWKILLFPHWQLYGELNIQSIDGSDQEDCTNVTSIWEADPSIKRCPQKDWTVPLIAAVYLMLSNLLLVNIVIAKFSFIFEKVQKKSEKLWHYERYQGICEYKKRIPSLLNIPIRVFQLFYYGICFKRKGFCSNKVHNDSPSQDTYKDLEAFQKMIAVEIHKRKQKKKINSD